LFGKNVAGSLLILLTDVIIYAISYAGQYGTKQLVRCKLKVEAFDIVNTEILLKKLAAIRMLWDDWYFKNYLTYHTQYTEVNGHLKTKCLQKLAGFCGFL
jgi:hypothetical protein